MAIDGLNTGSLSEQLVGSQIVATAGNGYIAAELSATEPSDTFASVADAVVSGTLVVSEVGADTFAAVADAVVSGTLAVSEVGADTFAAVADVVVSGTLVVSEVGSDTFSAAGVVGVYAVFSATEGAQDSATITGAVQATGSLSATESIDTIYVLGDVQIHGSESASEFPDTGAGTGAVVVDGTADALEQADTLSGAGVTVVAGVLAVSESGLDTFAATGVVQPIGGEVEERRSRRLSVRSIADGRVFAHGGRATSAVHSPTLVVINPDHSTISFDGWGKVSGGHTQTSAGVVGCACGGGRAVTGGRAMTFTTEADAIGAAVVPVLGRRGYASAVVSGGQGKAYGGRSVVVLGDVDFRASSVATAKGRFAMTDAHFCTARGERKTAPSHIVAISALAAHGRFHRRVDTRTR
jgi:hypothetical protein